MKHLKKLLVVVAALAMAMAMTATAFAQTVAPATADPDNATITINNPAKGETYSIYKLFDATVSEDGAISYQGTVPEGLGAFFTADASGNISPTDAIAVKDGSGKITGTNMTPELKTALETWAKAAGRTATATAVSDGSALEFTGLPYGYYVMTTSHESDAPEDQEAKSAISVTSTQPDASIYDKNVNEPDAVKTVKKQSYSIGDTVKYTATFDTTNFMGEGADSQMVVEYVIEDTLPAYLSNVNVTKITVGGTEITVQQFDANKQIKIPWATQQGEGDDAEYVSNYAQGAQIVIEYEGVLTAVTNINAADKNTVSITPQVINPDTNEKEPWDESWKDDAVITTYAAAIKKVDENGDSLAGATFTFKGLVVESDANNPGVYTVVSYNPSADAAESAALATDEQGKLYIVGLASDVKLVVTEATAPDGYNKLNGTVELTPQVLQVSIIKKSGFAQYDVDGNLVEYSETETTDFVEVTKNLAQLDGGALEIENQTGVELPSTGGMGTTILYVVGGILVLLAVVFLVTKRRVASKKNDEEMI